MGAGAPERHLGPNQAKEESQHMPNMWANILSIPSHLTYGPSLVKIPLQELIIRG